MNQVLSTLSQAKDKAKRLRAFLAGQGEAIGHARAPAAGVVARDYGFRDWNALHAAIRDRPPQYWTPGGRVTGRYSSQPFERDGAYGRPGPARGGSG